VSAHTLAGRAHAPKHPSLRRPAPWSLAPAGTCEGLFRVVYHFENEQLLELINRTAHAAALSALVETTNGYRFYFGVYVRSVSRLTPIYMAMIDPFRKLVVYPSLLRNVRAKWNKTFGTA
jgi:hypothetical protein